MNGNNCFEPTGSGPVSDGGPAVQSTLATTLFGVAGISTSVIFPDAFVCNDEFLNFSGFDGSDQTEVLHSSVDGGTNIDLNISDGLQQASRWTWSRDNLENCAPFAPDPPTVIQDVCDYGQCLFYGVIQSEQLADTRGCIFGSDVIPDGETRTFYNNPEATDCSGASTERTCRNRVLEGDLTYSSAVCYGGRTCRNTGTYSYTIRHGSSRTFWQQGGDGNCARNVRTQTRTCNNGSLSGSYRYTYCTDTSNQ